jgi:hypothetical protein
VVHVVPQLCGDEQLLAGNAGLLDGIADCSFGAVDARSVDVAITRFQCGDYSSAVVLVWPPTKVKHAHVRFLGLLILPCAEPNGWDLSSSVELESGTAVSHSELLRLRLYLSCYL